MAPSGTGTPIWDDPKFLFETTLAFYELANVSGGLTVENKEAVIKVLGEKGFTINWNGLR